MVRAVGQAIEAGNIMEYETDWTESDLKKRVVRCITCAAANTQLSSYSWKDACTRLVQQALGTYGTACKDRGWVLGLDLTDALSEAAWEMLQRHPVVKLPRPRDVYAVVHEEFQDCLDRLEIHRAFGVIVYTTDGLEGREKSAEMTSRAREVRVAKGAACFPAKYRGSCDRCGR